jgi:hypothetical protein
LLITVEKKVCEDLYVRDLLDVKLSGKTNFETYVD